MNNQRLHHTNSNIRVRKERTENIAFDNYIIRLPILTILIAIRKYRCSILTIPNGFKQCMISLLIIHYAIFKDL